MVEQEEWNLGTAVAVVVRTKASVGVSIRGVLTTMAYEALHLRLLKDRHRRRFIVIDDSVLVVATPKSLSEAASRASPARRWTLPIEISVPAWRFSWATHHCELAEVDGVALLPAASRRAGRAWASVRTP